MQGGGVATSRSGGSVCGCQPPENFEIYDADSYFQAHFWPENKLTHAEVQNTTFPLQAVLHATSTG